MSLFSENIGLNSENVDEDEASSHRINGPYQRIHSLSDSLCASTSLEYTHEADSRGLRAHLREDRLHLTEDTAHLIAYVPLLRICV